MGDVMSWPSRIMLRGNRRRPEVMRCGEVCPLHTGEGLGRSIASEKYLMFFFLWKWHDLVHVCRLVIYYYIFSALTNIYTRLTLIGHTSLCPSGYVPGNVEVRCDIAYSFHWFITWTVNWSLCGLVSLTWRSVHQSINLFSASPFYDHTSNALCVISSCCWWCYADALTGLKQPNRLDGLKR